MSGTSTCESLTCNAKIPEIARKSGCGGIGIRARLRCVWHYVLASSSLAIRIEYVKQLLTVLAVGSCFVLSGFSRKSIEYRRVRIHQISLSAIELLTESIQDTSPRIHPWRNKKRVSDKGSPEFIRGVKASI